MNLPAAMPAQLTLDNSQIRTFLECPRKFQFRYEWDLATGLDPWLVSGRAWGAAQDVIWSQCHLMDAGLMDRAISAFEDSVRADLPRLSPEASDDWRITSRHHYHEALADHLQIYSRYIVETLDPAQTICEVPFEVPLTGFTLIGRMDKIVFNLAEGSWWVIEHKTTSRWLSDSYLEHWRNHNQIRTYGFVGRKRWGDAFGGVLVDCASITKRGRTDFRMVPVTFPPLAGGEWQKDMEDIARDVTRARAGEARWKKNTDACERFGWMCPYFEACVIGYDPRGAPENWGLHVEHWDPREHAQLQSEPSPSILK